MKKLNMNDLEKINGGFKEENKGLPTYGKEIVCPKCKSKLPASFVNGALYDPKIGSVEYTCHCGCSFVCYQDQVILKNDWLSLCKDKGISYVFQ